MLVTVYQQVETIYAAHGMFTAAVTPPIVVAIFLGVMYLMFLFSINIGSAFIDLFDGIGAALFVEGPRQLLDGIGAPGWLTVLIADGVVSLRSALSIDRVLLDLAEIRDQRIEIFTQRALIEVDLAE